MKKEATVKLALDSKHKDRVSKPLRIAVTFNRRTQQYSIGEDILLTKEEFANKNLKSHKQAMEKAAPALSVAKKIVSELNDEFAASDNVSIVFAKFKERFRNEYFGRTNRTKLLFTDVAEEYISNRNIAHETAQNYRVASSWIRRYRKDIGINSITDELVNDIINFIKAEHLKAKNKEVSENTIRIYLRSLKAVYNYAISKGYVKGPNPFRATSAQPHTSIRRDYIAISEETLKKLSNYTPKNKRQEFALDFSFLLMHLSGCNIGDALNLKNENIQDDKVTFRRRKTNKAGVHITFNLTHTAKEILSKYGKLNPDRPHDYILPYLHGSSSDTNIHTRKDRITNKINDGLKEICTELNIPVITTGTFRHTYATVLLNRGVSVGLIQRFLGHTDVRTTQSYLDSLSNDNLTTNEDILEDLAAYQPRK